MEFSAYFPVWSKLTPQQQTLLRENTVLRKASKGTPIHSSTDCTGLVLVRDGQLRAHILSEGGREITIYRLFPRDLCLFSAACIMNSLQFDIHITAEKDTEFWLIHPDTFKHLMEESAPVANLTSEIMGSRFSEAMWLIEQILWKSLDKRVAAFLLEESVIEESDNLQITHETIANHLGTHREVVTRMLRYLQNEGTVKLSRGSIAITDPLKLRALSEE